MVLLVKDIHCYMQFHHHWMSFIFMDCVWSLSCYLVLKITKCLHACSDFYFENSAHARRSFNFYSKPIKDESSTTKFRTFATIFVGFSFLHCFQLDYFCSSYFLWDNRITSRLCFVCLQKKRTTSLAFVTCFIFI